MFHHQQTQFGTKDDLDILNLKAASVLFPTLADKARELYIRAGKAHSAGQTAMDELFGRDARDREELSEEVREGYAE